MTFSIYHLVSIFLNSFVFKLLDARVTNSMLVKMFDGETSKINRSLQKCRFFFNYVDATLTLSVISISNRKSLCERCIDI